MYDFNDSGPISVSIENKDRPVATVTKLPPGEYQFRLTVTDKEGRQGEAMLSVTSKENVNRPPKANAGGDKEVYMPITLVALDGRMSTDDVGIKTYQWIPSPNSLATAVILNGSDMTPVLQLTRLVEGRYVYNLTVRDAQGLSSSDSINLVVHPSKHMKDLVEVHLRTDVHSFTQQKKEELLSGLTLLLHRMSQENVKLQIEDIKASPTGVVIRLYAVRGSNQEVWQGEALLQALQHKQQLEELQVASVSAVVCQSNCSGHGHCEQITKQCVCDAFWMQDFFKAYFWGQETNCDWSVLYVILVCFILLIILITVIWAIVLLCKRWYRTRPKKRHRYTLLEDVSDEPGTELAPKEKGRQSKIQNNSIMVSESDDSSDQETLFINKKLKNGQLKNGITKSRTKVRT